MRDAIMYPGSAPRAFGKLSKAQLSERAGWETLGDNPATSLASLRLVSMYPAGGSTITQLTTLDPGTARDKTGFGPGGFGTQWFRRPGGYGYVTTRQVP